MFIVLERNNDPMAGGPTFRYISTFSTKDSAEVWIERKLGVLKPHERSWVTYSIAQLVG